MSAKKEKILKDIKKGIKEFDLMQSGKMKSPDFNTVLQDLKTERDNRGGAGRGQGRKSAGYTTRIWVTPEEKTMILAARSKAVTSR
jgi:hypothetical protein